jgi:thiol-disulfide isomerase/thioredoxin
MKEKLLLGPSLATVAGMGVLWLVAGCAASSPEPEVPATRVIEATAAFAAVGEPAPNFELPWLNHDGPATLAELRGRVVLLEFWRSTCGPCMRMVPRLNELHEKLAPAGLAVVAVSNESEERIQDKIEAVRMAYPVARLTGSTVDDAYRIRAVPQAFLIDRSGTLVWRGHPSKLTEEHVAALLE